MVDKEHRSVFGKGIDEVKIGEVLTVRTFEGKDGGVIGRLPDGRVVLFSKDSVYHDMLGSGQVVEARVVRATRTYVIADPLSPPKTGVDALKASLKALTESKDWEHAVIAEALLHVIQLAEKLCEGKTSRTL
jgi:hypothetical protein